MLIGEVARLSGVAAKTLRYYEDIGLIEPPFRDGSGYRDFDGRVLGRLGVHPVGPDHRPHLG